jgi:hypothetical protein
MKLTKAQEQKHPKYDELLERIRCENDNGTYTVLFWDDLHDALTVSQHKDCNSADKEFRKILVEVQKKGGCCRLLLVADDDYEVQRAVLTSYC